MALVRPTSTPTRDPDQEQTRPASQPSSRTARLAGSALALAALLAIAGFTALGSVFAYPQVLQEPVDAILTRFRAHQGAVVGWFGVLVVSAGLLAPAGVWLGRLAGGTLGRATAAVAVAAAVVQVVGLQRWLTLVPTLSRDALDPTRHAEAVRRFELWHTVLGTAIGETVGYALTATFTVLAVLGLRRRGLPRWLAAVGTGAAALIATGVAVPLVHLATLSNFVGYVLWCAWLLALAVWLFRAGGFTLEPERPIQPSAGVHAQGQDRSPTSAPESGEPASDLRPSAGRG